MLEFSAFRTWEDLMTFDYNKYKHKAGIYRFYNTINGKSYIGQSIDLGKRIYAHIRNVRRGDCNQVIYRAIRKHGSQNFKVQILTVFPEHENLRKNLDLSEKIYIEYYGTYKSGYNSTVGGDGGILGYKMSDEEKAKRSLAQKGKPKNPLIINHKAKVVYMYNTVSESFIVAASTMDGAEIANSLGYRVNPCGIQDSAKNRKKCCGNFLCSYDLEELKEKIKHFK